MPIGKNAIKRVENNGYSNVKTSAPDMENSNVIANVDKQVLDKMVAPVAAATAEKAAVESTPATVKKPAAKKTTKKSPTKKCTKKSGFERVSLCDDMPYYLL